MRIEAATAADFEAVNDLARQVHEMHVAWRPDLFRMTEHPVSQVWYGELLEKGQLWVLREKGRVLAYAITETGGGNAAGLVPRKIFSVNQLCVADSRRHQGLGRQFMESLMDKARTDGYTDLQLTVDPHNTDAVRFYESLGMKVKVLQYQRKL